MTISTDALERVFNSHLDELKMSLDALAIATNHPDEVRLPGTLAWLADRVEQCVQPITLHFERLALYAAELEGRLMNGALSDSDGQPVKS